MAGNDSPSQSPEEVASFLRSADPLMVVGGQAVNLWALHYQERVADLAPFVSRDVDILGDRTTLEAIARNVREKPQYFPIKPPSNAVGMVLARGTGGQPLLIEVLRYVHGASNEELRGSEYVFEIGPAAIPVRAPGPVALLKAKVANAADFCQKGRQDERHVRILIRVLPAYWRDLIGAVESGEIAERNLIGQIEAAFRIVQSKKGKTVLARLGILGTEVFAGLERSDLPKVQRFLEKRLSRLGNRRVDPT